MEGNNHGQHCPYFRITIDGLTGLCTQDTGSLPRDAQLQPCLKQSELRFSELHRFTDKRMTNGGAPQSETLSASKPQSNHPTSTPWIHLPK